MRALEAMGLAFPGRRLRRPGDRHGIALGAINSLAIAPPLFLGLLIPFAAAYLLERSHNCWALIPACVLIALSIVMLAAVASAFLAQSEILWPVAIMLIGAYLLLSSMRRRTVLQASRNSPI